MLIFPLLVLSVNVCIIQCSHLLGTDKKKNILTAIVATFIPIGFVAKREMNRMKNPHSSFAKFYLANNIIFTIVSLLALIAVNLVLYYDMLPSFYIHSCAGMPFTTCHQTWSDSLSSTGKYSNHVAFFFYGNAFYIAILILHLSLSFYFSKCCFEKIYIT
jgi:hypothetical protein